jgi:hypothetical protein
MVAVSAVPVEVARVAVTEPAVVPVSETLAAKAVPEMPETVYAPADPMSPEIATPVMVEFVNNVASQVSQNS